MIHIKNLDHIVIRANHPEKLIQFYCEVLGCSIERDCSAELGLVQLRAGQALIDIVSVVGILGQRGGRGPGKDGHNMDHFCVRIEPFDEINIRKHLANFNVRSDELTTRYGAQGEGPSLYIQDPEGNTIELKGPPIK